MSVKLIGAFVIVILIVAIVAYAATRPPKGLYMLDVAGSKTYNNVNYTGGYTYSQAAAKVGALGGVIPTKSQLATAFKNGWNVCNWGWFIDDTDPKNPVPKAMYATTNTNPGCGGPGILVGSTDQSNTWYAYGYGPRPDGVPDSQWLAL